MAPFLIERGAIVDARGQHGGTALHRAAWHGNAGMVKEVLRHDPPLEEKDEDYDASDAVRAALSRHARGA